MPELDDSGGLTSLQRPCLYQTVIRLILIREYLCLHPSCAPQATRQQEPWQLKMGKCHPPSPPTMKKINKIIHTCILCLVMYTLLGQKTNLLIKQLLD